MVEERSQRWLQISGLSVLVGGGMVVPLTWMHQSRSSDESKEASF